MTGAVASSLAGIKRDQPDRQAMIDNLRYEIICMM